MVLHALAMRPKLGNLGVLGAIAILACACGGGAPGEGGLDLPPRGGKTPGATNGDGTGATGGGDNAAAPAQQDDPQQPGSSTTTTPVGEVDTDKDGVPDSKDCDPQNPDVVGIKLLDDKLATDGNLFAPATGFSSTNWSYDTEAYRQTRLVDAADVSLFTQKTDVGDVDIQATGASTEISSTITPRLRQMFILVGTTLENGQLTAYGCGAEVVQGMTPEQRTSVVKLTGSASSVTTTAIQRTERTALQVNENFTIHAQLKAGTLTCTVTQGAGVTTTAKADNLGALKGSIGFFTRQTKAAFKDAKACSLDVPNGTMPAPK